VFSLSGTKAKVRSNKVQTVTGPIGWLSRAEQVGERRERQRLAQDLHDTVKPALFSANMIAEVLPQLWDADPAEGRRRLEELRTLTRTALAEVRTLLSVWRPAGLDDGGLGKLLAQLGAVVSSQTQVAVSVTAEGEWPLPPEVALALYRIAQEALNNMARHSGATGASVTLRWQGDRAHLAISDNGRGFDPAVLAPGHLGLSIMHERAASVGAGLDVVSQPGGGTAVTVTWPQAERVKAQ
jgi:signal transduction histidine kinase